MKILILFLAVSVSSLLCVQKQSAERKGSASSNCDIDIAAIEDTAYTRTVGNSNQHKQIRKILQEEIFDKQAIKSLNLVNCNRKRISPGCTVDTLELHVSDKGVYVEYSQTYTSYTLYKDFPVAPCGIAPGMTTDQVMSILGKPELEHENRLQYESDDGRVVMAFKDGKLHIVCFSETVGDCME